MNSTPIIWSVAGTDSGGGAGLAADLRAADAFGVHACMVVAAITAQHSQAVQRVDAVSGDLLAAQLDALANDLPPRVIKTGVLGSAANVRLLARHIDQQHQRGPLALVVDPVLRASSGDALADRELLAALRDELLPRANMVTPNRAEAALLLGWTGVEHAALPDAARALQALGAQSVCITGGDEAGRSAMDWLQSPDAEGWLSLPRVATRHTHGTGCSFASALAAALALGFVSADAAVLAKMAVAHALHEDAARPCPGTGPGPVRLRSGFGQVPALLPWLSDEIDPPAPPPMRGTDLHGLYAIVDSAERVDAALAAGVRTLQLRIKTAGGPPTEALRTAVARAVTACQRAGAQLFINDHWALALELGATGVHLGQEDLLALNAAERAQLRAAQQRGLALGLSSHSLWELCRAAAWQPAYIACGPVWPTDTKRMPWRPQGLHNLAWWCAMAPAPVVAIGGILDPARAAEAARCGAAAVCILRGLGEQPAQTLPAFVNAITRARREAPLPCPPLPRPSLAPAAGDGRFNGRCC
ncbi:bifunctional hydroxymethylpyrimidine kinase/phosphomethylpyrimidine kinase [Aquabacterium sp.]|uniref:bifunctional hydroxymethylpyrimidine kinase/phosphomethylpyrimidine kinase n=1 Tax=Aquabacterium sp. TaxID=1872578 RepID=UPI002CC830F3|nr:bifunctional hydroxymethylpyrimidine kinase/phosphomethylpyrimidine kinase [Aquabacterium sp.]HSW03696.1 bifunctional hydroxymethylpyrimidine kinase/phosphomethylpyrimidine kinase [Aquabacterium sp.]